jgi:hypothetical protein
MSPKKNEDSSANKCSRHPPWGKVNTLRMQNKWRVCKEGQAQVTKNDIATAAVVLWATWPFLRQAANWTDSELPLVVSRGHSYGFLWADSTTAQNFANKPGNNDKNEEYTWLDLKRLPTWETTGILLIFLILPLEERVFDSYAERSYFSYISKADWKTSVQIYVELTLWLQHYIPHFL